MTIHFPWLKAFRQIIFYCNMKRTHYWRRVVITWNKLFLVLWKLWSATYLTTWCKENDRTTSWKKKSLFQEARSSISTWMGNESNSVHFLLHLALGIVIWRSQQKTVMELTHSLACLAPCYKFPDVKAAVTGLQTQNIR